MCSSCGVSPPYCSGAWVSCYISGDYTECYVGCKYILYADLGSLHDVKGPVYLFGFEDGIAVRADCDLAGAL